MKTPAAIALAVTAMALAGATVAPAQVGPPRRLVVPVFLQVTARNDLTFGTVLPGIRTAINPHDVHRAGLFEIQGPANASVRIEFTLPAALTADGGGYLPLTFAAGDGYSDVSPGGPPHGVTFDPRAALVTTLSADGRLFVRLGGSVQPLVPQLGGAYRATITLSVFDLGT